MSSGSYTKGGFGINKTYTPYHMHTDYSLLDSCTNYQDYIKLAVENNQTAISFTEHGKPLGWVSKKVACDDAGIKFMHGVEIYLTESLAEKVRDNYHTVLIARDETGIQELNRLVTMSCNADHFYYVNRLSFDEFLNISDHIISTSACLASPLHRLDEMNPMFEKLVQKYTFLELQAHNHPDQIEFNKKLVDLANKYGKPLIAGTDTHSSSKYKAECRAILLQAKHKSYGDEDRFDLSYKTYDELVEMFRVQDAIPADIYLEAIENTNYMASMVENFTLDTSIKYPILYGTPEKDSEVFEETVARKFKEKVDSGVIPPQQVPAFEDAIKEEMRVFKKLGMSAFMLSMSELVGWCKENGMAIGTARGSVGGSRVAYITDIIDMNPEQWGTIFSRFCNENRVELGDIDTDVIDTDRPAIFKHIIERFGEEKTARVASFGTLADKATIEEICRALRIKWNVAHGYKEDEKVAENPYSYDKTDKIKSEFESDPDKARGKHKDIFQYYDGILGTKISQSVHPAGMIISPINLIDAYGMFDKDNEKCLMLDMEEAHHVNLVKYDFLILKSVKVIRDACREIGIPYPKSHEINFDDQEVWEDISRNPAMIFQFESKFGADSLKKMFPTSINDMSLVTACIRPSGASYRDELLKRHVHKNPSEFIDEILKDNLGYLVYQEDVSRFLMDVCGMSGSTADSVRRGIAKKRMDILDQYFPQMIEGYCSKSDKPREEAEQEAKEFIQVVQDASAYMFNKSHSIAYCLLGYYYGYFRHYYPLEFITAYLNDAANDDDIKTGTVYANSIGIKVTMPKWGISRGNYDYDKEQRIIAKGLSSIKYMSEKIAEELYDLSKKNHYECFVDLLYDLNNETSLDSRQLDILIKLDFFSEFGNQRELLRINDLFHDRFKCGDAKKISKEEVDGTPIAPIVQKYSVGVTKSGAEAKSYTLLDIHSILRECEELIKQANMPDLSDTIKVRNFYDTMGYIGYTSGKPEDRRKLYVLETYPVCRKKDGKQFGYSIITKSIGSGVDGRFTVFNNVYNKDPISKGDIIYCRDFKRDGQYFQLTSYEKVI